MLHCERDEMENPHFLRRFSPFHGQYIYFKSNTVNSTMSFKIFNDMAPHAPFFRYVKFDLDHDMDLIILVHTLQEQSKPKDSIFFFF